MNATDCDLCGCKRTAAEVEYLPYPYCCECSELVEEAAHFARGGEIYGEGPCEMTPAQTVATTSGSTSQNLDSDARTKTTTVGVTGACVEHSSRVPLPRPSPMARVRVQRDPWGVLAAVACVMGALIWWLA